MEIGEHETLRYVDGEVDVDVILTNDGRIWMSQTDMARLFCYDRTTISFHLKRIFKDSAWEGQVATIREVRLSEGRFANRTKTVYSQEIILVVAHRIGSPGGEELLEWVKEHRES